ncbi:rho guanine nucleotide exchange factor 10-like protein isoform X1 [Tachypleus tridentatus]|uniref:rho guanine nucleotide exchange factor 10-like protein isoform X1 n=1 Tax=Tachypleus tridentatus TaxID=6853 RepID=UPI003FCF0FA0
MPGQLPLNIPVESNNSMASKVPYYYGELVPRDKEISGLAEENTSTHVGESSGSDHVLGFHNPLLSIEPDITTAATACKVRTKPHQKKKKKKKKGAMVNNSHVRSNSLTIQNGGFLLPVTQKDLTGSVNWLRTQNDQKHRRRSSEPNIYEEIPVLELPDDPILYSGSLGGYPMMYRRTCTPLYSRSLSACPTSGVQEEVAKVQKRQAKILENLNLDIETMLMPEPPVKVAEKEFEKILTRKSSDIPSSKSVESRLGSAASWTQGRYRPKPERTIGGRCIMNEYVIQQSGLGDSHSSLHSACGGWTVASPSEKSSLQSVSEGPLYMLYDDSHRNSPASVLEVNPDDNIYEEVDLDQLGSEDGCRWGGGGQQSASSGSEDSKEESSGVGLAARIMGKKKKKGKKNRKLGEKSGGAFTRWFSTRKKEYDIERSMVVTNSNSFHGEETYYDIKLSKKQRPPLSLPPAPSCLSPEQLKRRYIIGSIVDSENSYVTTLQRLIKDYKRPLEECSAPLVSPAKINIMFFRVEQILQCHTIFGIALSQCVREWDAHEKIGDVFVASFSKAMVLDIYSDFINNFSLAMETAKQASKNKSAFADFLKVKQISSTDRLSFFGLMVKPVQRFPQFILLLQDLLKHTPPGHHDRMSLQLALTQLESLAETLNERKRESEQHYAVREVLKHLNNKFSLKSIADTDHYLLRQDDVLQLEVDQHGLVVKSKGRQLFLLNDLLVCVSVVSKSSEGSHGGERFNLKWAVPLMDVEVQENVAPATRNLLASSERNRTSISRGTGNGGTVQCVYDELSDLVHDLEIMSRISSLVASLRLNYSDLSLSLICGLSQNIQEKIRKKDEEITRLDSCCLQLSIPVKSKIYNTITSVNSLYGSNKELVCLQLRSPSVKREWITDLHLSKLALDANNTPAWDIPEQEKRPTSKMPLFAKTVPVFSALGSTEVKCGCYYTLDANSFNAITYLWLCSTDGIKSYLVVMSVQPTLLQEIATFDLQEVQITAIEAVPALAEGLETVWLGTESRRIVVLSGSSPQTYQEVGVAVMPALAMHIRYHFERVFAGLSDGSIVVFQKSSSEEVWELRSPLLVNLGPDPISYLLPLGLALVCSAGRNVILLDGQTAEPQRSYSLQHEEGHAHLLAHSGTGLWISLYNSATICLYHTETFRHLQDINVASSINHLFSGFRDSNIRITVTSLLASRGLLWVGTNVGVILTVPLPRLEGVPIISGRTNVAYHGHHGPVTLLLSLLPRPAVSAPCNTREEEVGLDVVKPDSQPPCHEKVKKQKSDSMIPPPFIRPHVAPVRKSAADIHMSGAKTLPRGMNFHQPPTAHSYLEDSNNVYGLYADLMNIHDYDRDSQERLHERLNQSDSDLAAFHVITLDRRLKQKTGRPRSWDLSNMAVSEDSDSSAACEPHQAGNVGGSGSTANSGKKISALKSHHSSTSLSSADTRPPPTAETCITKYSARASRLVNQEKTVLTVTGGCGYINWKKAGEKQSERKEAHIIMWEMKL